MVEFLWIWLAVLLGFVSGSVAYLVVMFCWYLVKELREDDDGE